MTPRGTARLCAFVGALLLALHASPVVAAAPDAPLGVATPGPFRGLFLDLPLADAGAPAALAIDVRWWLANDWSKPTVVSRDGRTVRLQGDAQYDTLQVAVTVPWRRFLRAPFARRLSTTVEAHASVIWGGWTDGLIEDWHRLIGSSNFQRQLSPRDRVHLRLSEDGGPTLADVHSAGVVLGDLVVRNQLVLVGVEPGPSGAPPRGAIAVRLDLKLPTGPLHRLGGSGGADAGLGLAGTVRAGPLTVHALASARVVSGLPQGFALQPRRLQAGGDLSLVLRVGRRVALLLEDRLSTPLMRSGWRLPANETQPEATTWYALFRAHNQVSGGVRIGEVTVFLSEDFTPGGRIASDPGPRWFYDSNAPDIVIGVSWARDL